MTKKQLASPAVFTSEQRRHLALDYRMAGMTYKQIGNLLGVSFQRAYQLVMSELERIRKDNNEAAENVRKLEEERLNKMLQALWPQVINGNQGAVDRVLRVMERRARLLGLDAPIKQEVTGKDGGPILIVKWDDSDAD